MSGLRQGLVQIYTGAGKGKTSAALGLAVRAAGRGLRTCIIQFLKRGRESGEQLAVERLAPEVEIHAFGAEQWGDPATAPAGAPWWERSPSQEDRHQAQKAMDAARRATAGGEWDIVVLDEVFAALKYELVSLDQLLRLLRAKPPQVELVLTGRDAPEEVVEAADLVTEMVDRKHPFRRGVGAREGIEY